MPDQSRFTGVVEPVDEEITVWIEPKLHAPSLPPLPSPIEPQCRESTIHSLDPDPTAPLFVRYTQPNGIHKPNVMPTRTDSQSTHPSIPIRSNSSKHHPKSTDKHARKTSANSKRRREKQRRIEPFPIPRIIHQTWKDDNVPVHWKPSIEAWKRLHPDYTHILWTDEDNLAFMTEQYPHLLDLYLGWPYNIGRADMVRYCILDYYGGIYCDLDQKPLQNVDRFFKGTDNEAYFGSASFAWVTNALMASKPGAKVWQKVFIEMRRAAEDGEIAMLNRHFYIMMTTGPIMLTRAIRSYHEGVLGVLPSCFNPHDYDESANPFMVKLQGSGSWHEWDSRILESMIPHKTWFIVIFLVCFILGLIFLVLLFSYGMWSLLSATGAALASPWSTSWMDEISPREWTQIKSTSHASHTPPSLVAAH